MPKTIDPEDFDIHEFEESKPKVYPLKEKEKINSKTLEGITESEEEKKTSKKVFTAIIANVILPGLGNLIIKKNKFGSILLILNGILLIIGMLPTSFLGFLGNLYAPKTPILLLDYAIITSSKVGNTNYADPLSSGLVYLAIIIAAIAWLHLIYLIAKK
ncbi:hypothetical protein KKB11_05350 [Candidatus Micrarchaeota archaeon]|nr:hypothetical protein [Candidatus Micrarchaeota archaeon]